MFYHELLKILIGPAGPAAFVHLEIFLMLSGFVAYLSWKVDIPCRKQVVIHKPVEGALADHKRIHVISADVIKRLPTLD
jgi:hypothetical protein